MRARLRLAPAPVAQAETNPPGYYMLLKLVIATAGQGETALRLPSVIAGTLAVIPVALVARRVGGPVAAVVAAGLLALSAPLARALLGASEGDTVAFNGREEAIEVLSVG